MDEKTKSERNLGLGDDIGYGWAICGLALTQHVTPMTAKKEDEKSFKKQEKSKKKRTVYYED